MLKQNTMETAHHLAEKYLSLYSDVKQKAADLARDRKQLKALGLELQESMKQENVNRIEFDAHSLSLAIKLNIEEM